MPKLRAYGVCAKTTIIERESTTPQQQTIGIVGGGDGIGAVRRLATKGEKAVLIGTSPAKAAAVAKEVGAPCHVADFADLAQVRDSPASWPAVTRASTCSPTTSAGSWGPRANHAFAGLPRH
ncbi:hypothetical protein AB0H88_15930 [Nonomuraea sp. NPDC050680]|uniref:hypothetical protein n=1 Tax=Nonomuraea sp. NPDC050680 TaxID=3154630 RepID=UPI0033C90418